MMSHDEKEVNRLYATKEKLQIEFIIVTTTVGEETDGKVWLK
jgi:hypothetical protein